MESGNFFYDATKAPPGDCKIQQYLCVVTLFTVIKTEKNAFNPLHPNISKHILHTVLYTFPKVLTRRIGQQSMASFVGDHFLYFRDLNL